jgi:hypothetical protein
LTFFANLVGQNVRVNDGKGAESSAKHNSIGPSILPIIHHPAKGLIEERNGRIGGWHRNENNINDDCGESEHSSGQNSAGTTEETTGKGQAEYWQHW